MGTFKHSITLIAQARGDTETLNAVVDTGATFTVVPAPILEHLGVRPQRKLRLRLANGEVVEWDLGEVVAQLNGVTATILCILAEPDAPSLIGAHTLEASLVMMEPIEQRLVPTEGLLL